MARFIFLAFSAFLSFSVLAAQGDLISVKELAPFDTKEIQGNINAYCSHTFPKKPPHIQIGSSNIRVFALIYETIDLKGQKIVASGALMVPDLNKPLPILSYQHGTTINREDVPSRRNIEGSAVGSCYGSQGYAVVAADYLGYGDSPGFHPYMHVKSAAIVSADLLRAVRKAAGQIHISFNGKLFLTGYSQGGSNTMALERYIESDLNKEFSVTATSPMAGPYDLEGTFLELLDQPSDYTAAEFAFIGWAYNKIYATLPPLADSIQAPYVDRLESSFDGSSDWGAVLNAFPSELDSFLVPAFVEKVRLEKNHPLRVALRENNVYDWKPAAPMLILQGADDDMVPMSNTKKACARMKELGADVECRFIDNLSHEWAVRGAIPESITWFERFNPRD